MYGNPLTAYTIECRNNPQYINKEASDWCGCGLWRIWSDRLKCWTHYYYHEGLDDTTTEYFELHKVAPVIEGKTPAQALGYKEGDLFIVSEDCEFDEGEIVELIHDDETTCPSYCRHCYICFC